MIASRPALSKRTRRRGVAAVEAGIILPLFLAAVLAAVGLSDLIITEQLLAEASNRGARVAALGGSQTKVVEAVQAILGDSRMEHATVSIRRINKACTDPVEPGELVEVRVEIPAKYATATLLAPISSDETLTGRTVMCHE